MGISKVDGIVLAEVADLLGKFIGKESYIPLIIYSGRIHRPAGQLLLLEQRCKHTGMYFFYKGTEFLNAFGIPGEGGVCLHIMFGLGQVVMRPPRWCST